MISMNDIWDETVALARREAALLIPVALATIYVGGVISTLASSAAKPTEPNMLVMVATVISMLLSIIGQLSIVSLVLKPGQSVGEALAHGASRLGKVVLVALLLGVVLAFAFLPLAIGAAAAGFDPANPEAVRRLPGWLLFMILLTSAFVIWVAIRLALMNALIVDRNPGVIESIKTGFALSRGVASRLFLLAALYGTIWVVLSFAVRFVAGSMFALIGAAMGSPFAGVVMTALVSELVTTALSLMLTIFLALLYRRVSRQT